jgi:hypothetical protein
VCSDIGVANGSFLCDYSALGYGARWVARGEERENSKKGPTSKLSERGLRVGRV